MDVERDKENAHRAADGKSRDAATRGARGDGENDRDGQRLGDGATTPSSAYEPRVRSLAARVRMMSAVTPRAEADARASASTSAAVGTRRAGTATALLDEYCASADETGTPTRGRKARNALANAVRENQENRRRG